MHIRDRQIIIVILCATGVMSVLAAGPPPVRLRPGQYERTTQTTIPGRPPAPSGKTLQCITAEDLKDFSKAMNTRAVEPDCGVAVDKQSATEVRYTRICIVGGARMTSKAIITFPTTETFRAVVETKRTGGLSSDQFAIPQASTTTMTARRIGDCSK